MTIDAAHGWPPVPTAAEETEAHFDVVRFVYSVSGWLCLCLGLPLNGTLVWLILNKSLPAMRMYARLLLYTCFMDILLVLVTSSVQPILIADHGYRLLIQNGIFRGMPEPYALILDSVWLQLLVCYDISTTFQFVFRYLLLTSDGKMSSRVVCALIGLAVAGNMLHYAVMIWADWPRAEYAPQIAHMTELLAQETGITDLQIASFSVGSSFAWHVHAGFMIVLFFGCYGLIVTCTVKTRRFIQRQMLGHLGNKEFDQKVMDINNQITQALILQAVLPTFELIAFTLKIFLPMLCSSETWFYIIYTAVPLYFIPVLSPLGTIIMVKPYRRAVAEALRRGEAAARGQVWATRVTNLAPEKRTIPTSP